MWWRHLALQPPYFQAPLTIQAFHLCVLALPLFELLNLKLQPPKPLRVFSDQILLLPLRRGVILLSLKLSLYCLELVVGLGDLTFAVSDSLPPR